MTIFQAIFGVGLGLFCSLLILTPVVVLFIMAIGWANAWVRGLAIVDEDKPE